MSNRPNIPALNLNLAKLKEATKGRVERSMRDIEQAMDHFATTEAIVLREAEDYLNHGVHRRPRHGWQVSDLTTAGLETQIAEMRNWRVVYTEMAYNGTSEMLRIPKASHAAGLGVDLDMILGEGTPVSRYDKTEGWVSYTFAGNAGMQLLDRWIAKCYRSPDMMKMITKRGSTPHEYY